MFSRNTSPTNKLRVVLGTIDLEKTKFSYKVEKYVINGCYDSDYSVDDIALMRTTQDIIPVLGNHSGVGTVCLPKQDSESTQTEVYQLGWGINETYGSSVSEILQKGKTFLHSEQYCLYADQYVNIGLTGGWEPLGFKLCARNPHTSACNVCIDY